MLKEPSHLSDQDILLVIDGEASRRCAKQAQAHLTACWSCRARLRELEGTIADFVSLHRRTPDSQMPDAGGPRALLKARLTEAAAMPSNDPWHRFLQLPPYRTAACLCAAVFVAVMGGMFWKHSQLHGSGSGLSVASLAIPDQKLTPGATRTVSIGDV
jgi:anti-sigma factor RsiW